MKTLHTRGRMNVIIRCDQPTCTWQWRHFADQALEAEEQLMKHQKACAIKFLCPYCLAKPGQPCVSRLGALAHQPHHDR